MNWAWTTSIEQLWRSPSFPIWLTLAAAVFFGIIVLITLLRADRSVANGALALITLVAIAVAVASTLRIFGPDAGGSVRRAAAAPALSVAMPALACVDDLAGDTVLTACETALFGSADAVAAAVSYAAARISRLTALGDVATANKSMTPELVSLRGSIERDRYGLVAHVLAVRDHCQANDCAAYASLTDHDRIAANIDGNLFDATVQRHAPTWTEATAPAAAPAIAGVPAGLPPSVPTGKPTTADFPTADSIPPVNIMTPEPPLAAPAPTPSPQPKPAAANHPAQPPSSPTQAQARAPHPATHPAAKKPPKPKPQVSAPVQLTPVAPDDGN